MTTLPGPHGAAALRATKQLLATPVDAIESLADHATAARSRCTSDPRRSSSSATASW